MTPTRRMFLGSLAAAGVGGAGALTLMDFPAAAQGRTSLPVVAEIKRQLKEGIAKVQLGQSVGARQLASMLRLYAATIDNAMLRDTLARADLKKVLAAEPNHAEMVRLANELGVNPTQIHMQSTTALEKEVALNRIIAEGLSPMMLKCAEYIDGLVARLEQIEGNPAAKARLQQVLLRQSDCGLAACQQTEAQLHTAMDFATGICAAMVLFPVLAPVCEAASATVLTMLTAAATCWAAYQICCYFSMKGC
jgi:hypothetical protein